jgi:protein Jumonji
VLPTFCPSDEEWRDPIAYIASVRDKAEPYGMCLITPPPSWRMESKVNDEIRFTTQVQHLHRLYNRWDNDLARLQFQEHLLT